MTPEPTSRLNATALLSVVVGVFGTICFFWGIAGIGAIVLGVVANPEIKRSEGRQHGQGLAIAGIVLGALHLFAIVIGMAALFTFAAHPPSFLTPAVPPKVAAPFKLAPPPPAPSAPPVRPAGERAGSATREAATRVTPLGKLTLVDPGTEVRSLAGLVKAQRALADTEHQKLVLWVTSVDCAPCNGVSVALSNRRLQEALAGVRLLRVDTADFHHDLVKLGVPVDVRPGFALLDASGAPSDYVSGGEWDADIPENIAPVLGGFVRGTYRTRRNPWTGPARSDETAL
jgi:hypothetical protein